MPTETQSPDLLLTLTAAHLTGLPDRRTAASFLAGLASLSAIVADRVTTEDGVSAALRAAIIGRGAMDHRELSRRLLPTECRGPLAQNRRTLKWASGLVEIDLEGVMRGLQCPSRWPAYYAMSEDLATVDRPILATASRLPKRLRPATKRLLQSFIALPAGRGTPQRPGPLLMPSDVTSLIAHWRQREPIVVPYEADVRRVLIGLSGTLRQQVAKLSMLFACGRAPHKPVIDLRDVATAIKLSWHARRYLKELTDG